MYRERNIVNKHYQQFVAWYCWNCGRCPHDVGATVTDLRKRKLVATKQYPELHVVSNSTLADGIAQQHLKQRI
jgi:hypothetical protein